MADLSNVGTEIIYCEATKTITLNYPNETVRLQRAPTPIIDDIGFIEEEEEDEDIPSSQNI